MLYLCCPYSHSSPTIREHRYHTSCIAAAKLLQAGIVVFNPLANSIPAEEFGKINLRHDQWMAIDLPILCRSDEILVLSLDGWEQSLGVRKEMFQAMALRKHITLISEADIECLPAIPKTARYFLTSSILTEVYDAD